jgi:hypothetical protein
MLTAPAGRPASKLIAPLDEPLVPPVEVPEAPLDGPAAPVEVPEAALPLPAPVPPATPLVPLMAPLSVAGCDPLEGLPADPLVPVLLDPEDEPVLFELPEPLGVPDADPQAAAKAGK